MDDAQLAALLIGGIGTLLGLVFVTFGVLRGRMVRGWSRTTGVVVNRDGSTTGLAAQYPTFQWRDQHGEDHRHTSIVRGSLGPRPGTPVVVLFDPDEPSRGVIDSMVQSGRIFVIIGIVIVVVAVGFAGFLFVIVNAFSTTG